MDAPNQVQLLKKIQLFKDEVVEGLEALRLPEIRKPSFLPEVVPTDDRA